MIAQNPDLLLMPKTFHPPPSGQVVFRKGQGAAGLLQTGDDSSGVTGTERFDELDAARGIAILMMILFHSLFDLYYFAIYPVNVRDGFWRYFALATGSLFLLIAGISLSVSHTRAKRAFAGDVWAPARIAGKFLVRGAGIFLCGMLVTVVTWILVPQSFIVFGILHLIGISIMISPLFFRFREKNILIGTVILLTGILLWIPPLYGPYWLLWIGVHPASFSTLDYYPLFPWFGVVLLGLGIGELLYPGCKRAFPAPHIPMPARIPLTFLGRHSLLIYLLHQPVILLVICLLTGNPLFW